MIINKDTTKSKLITAGQKLLNVTKTILQLCTDTSQIENVSEHKTLGLTIDHLTWNSHVHSLTKPMARNF